MLLSYWSDDVDKSIDDCLGRLKKVDSSGKRDCRLDT